MSNDPYHPASKGKITMTRALKLTRRIEDTSVKRVENHDYLILLDNPKPEDLQKLTEALGLDVAALAAEHLSDGIQEAMGLLQQAIEHYTDREQRVLALQNYRQKLEDLWKAGCLRRDRFQNLVVLIKAALAMFNDLSELTQTQLGTLVNVMQVLTEPIITYNTIGKCDDTLFEAGISTSPEITNLGSALVKT